MRGHLHKRKTDSRMALSRMEHDGFLLFCLVTLSFGLRHKHITIVNDTSRVIVTLESSITILESSFTLIL